MEFIGMQKALLRAGLPHAACMVTFTFQPHVTPHMLSMTRVDIVKGCVTILYTKIAPARKWLVSVSTSQRSYSKMVGLTDSTSLRGPCDVVRDCNAYLWICCGRKFDNYDCSIHTGKTFESPLPADTSSTHRSIVRFSSSPSTTTTILTHVTNSSPRATGVDHCSLSLNAVAGHKRSGRP